jgi:hypothetical protein
VNRVSRTLGVCLLVVGFAATATLLGASASSAASSNAHALPSVTSVAPSSGPGSGGTVVTITGTALKGVTKVDFVSGSSNRPGTNVVDVSNVEVQVTSPTGSPDSNPYDIEVTNRYGTSAANPGDEFTYTPDPTAGTIRVKASNLSNGKADTLTVKGTGWTPGLLIIVTICNADASNVSPFVQLKEFDFTPDACQPITLSLGAGGSFAKTKLSGPTAGDFTWTGTLIPGQLDPSVDSPLAECPQDQTQATQGVNCIVGVAELVGLSSDGNSADAPVFFAPSALGSSDVWQGGLGTSAQYNVDLFDVGAYTESNRPPVESANGVPNTGGFGTDGVICEAGTGPGSSPPEPCVVELSAPVENDEGVWTVSPTGCQAASDEGGTSWSSTPLCTYDEAAGEAIYIELTAYQPPKGTTLTNPIPLDTPLDCSGGSSSTDPFTCSVQANAGSNVFDPGGFNSDITNASTGQSPPVALQDLQPGTYTFEAIGERSGNVATGTIKLPLGPSS